MYYDTSELQNSLQLWSKNNKVNNLSCTILNKSNIKTINIINNDIINNDIWFEFASCTKLITSIGILKLEEENKLNIRHRVNKYIPKISKYLNKKITIKDLLSHASKYPSDGFLSYILDCQTERRDLTNENINFEKYISEIYNDESFRDTNNLNNYYYYNTGYILLGKIIEKVTGKTYEEYIKENVLSVVGIENSEFYPISSDSKLDKNRFKIKNRDINPAAGLITTTNEYAKLIQSLMNNKNILHKKSYDKITYPHNLSKKYIDNTKEYYGLGVKIQNYKNDTLISHSGFMTDSSWFGYLNDEKIGLVIACDGRPDNPIRIFGKKLILNQSKNISQESQSSKLDTFIENATGTYKLNNDFRNAIINKHSDTSLELKFGYEDNYESKIIQPHDIKNRICYFIDDDGTRQQVKFTKDFSKLKIRRWILNNEDSY